MPPRISIRLAASAALLLSAAPALAQSSDRPAGNGAIGTIIIAHGGDSIWNARVHEVVKRAKTGGPVEVSFLMGPGAKTAGLD